MKLVKTRLRSTIAQNRLESLIILSTEKDIKFNHDEVIDKYAMTSEVLKKQLMFK